MSEASNESHAIATRVGSELYEWLMSESQRWKVKPARFIADLIRKEKERQETEHGKHVELYISNMGTLPPCGNKKCLWHRPEFESGCRIFDNKLTNEVGSLLRCSFYAGKGKGILHGKK